ncbi:MAG TPA: ATP-binding protein [Blastocatellia bacterium]|nr:ATP-binding protein [Blastocatellia bacterium]
MITLRKKLALSYGLLIFIILVVSLLGILQRTLSISLRVEVTVAIAFVALAVAAIFAWRFTSYIVNPISTLIEKAKKIAEGDFDQHIEVTSQDEIGVLASEFNRMAVRLGELRKSDLGRVLIEQKKSDAVIDSFNDPIIVTDALGRITKINRRAEKLFELSGEEVGSDGTRSPSNLDQIEPILRAVQSTLTMQQPVANNGESAITPIKVGDTERAFRLHTSPVRDPEGRLIGAVTVLEDATAIREADRLKDEFISVASNKLRGPLESLRMALHTLAEQYAGELNEKQLELTITARQDGDQLDNLVTDLMDLAEIESGRHQLSLERLRPAEFVRSIVNRHRSAADCKHVKLNAQVMSSLPYVTADKEALKRILDNLLSNAIRHAGRDSEVIVEGWERKNFVFISVRDTGGGIPPEYLPNIFGRFISIPGSSGGGTGLGLALVKRLVEAQGGQVSVDSRFGESTSFTFTLPVVDYNIRASKESQM